jgi:aspartyl-tRNA(Asn)/glutamyl-tRNA(Gln) amidotransferase subunit A
MNVENSSAVVWDDPEIRSTTDIREMIATLLARIDEDERSINALITVMREPAMADAERLQQLREQNRRTPLDGLPIVLKDNIDVAGVRCTRGSKWFSDHVPLFDATVTSRLRKAGAVIVGKASLHEFAYGGTNNNPFYGAVRNPWDTERIPGGSSGGSGAALAADWCIGALGTDTGGSVRCPASFAGVTGLRPTMGVVSNSGTFHISPSFDTVGLMARRAGDVAKMFGAIVGFDPTDPQSVVYAGSPAQACPVESLDGLRIGVPHKYFLEEVDSEIAEAVLACARTLEGYGALITSDLDVPGAEEAKGIATLVIRAEALAIHRERLETDRSRFGEDVARRLDLGYELSGWQVARLYNEMLESRRALCSVFDTVDFVLTPTVPSSPGRIVDSEMIATTAEVTRFTYPWSVAHVPGLSLPCGFTHENLPIGTQLIGRAHADLMLCAIAELYQRETDWHLRRPAGVTARAGG